MLRKSFERLYKVTVTISSFFVLGCLILVSSARGQTTNDGDLRVTYFVSPEYPRLARQAMQSGDVVLTVTVDASGKPTDVAVQAPYPLLGGPAKETVLKWRFSPVPPPSSRKGHVFFHFSFSGTPRECNPSTIVAADLEGRRVIVTVDPPPPFAPDAFLAPETPTKKP